MHASLTLGQPAPVLARGALWLGPDDWPDMFGNVMGDYLARSSVSGGGIPGPASAEDRARVVGYFADGPGSGNAAPTFAEDRAARLATINPYGLPTSSAAQLIDDQGWTPSGGYGYSRSSDGITNWRNNVAATQPRSRLRASATWRHWWAPSSSA